MQKNKDYYLGIDCTGYSSLYQGGVGEYAKNIVTAICKTNHSKKPVVIVCSDESYDELRTLSDELVAVIRIYPRWFLFTRLIMSFSYYVVKSSKLLRMGQKIRWRDARKVLNNKCHMVYTPTTYANFPLKVHSLVSLHDIQEKTFPEFFSKKVLSFRHVSVSNTLEIGSSIQVSSDFVREEITRFYRSSSEFTNFVKIEEGVQLENRSNTDEKIRIQDRELRMVLPANFWKHKNQKVLIDALSDLNIPFEVVFTGQLFTIGTELQNDLRKISEEKFIFKGFIPTSDLLEIYQKSDIVISTSLYESSSLPILEGIAQGCFPIASRIPAHTEMAKSFNMFLFDPKEPQSLKAEVLRFHSLSSQEKDTLRKENLISIVDFDWRVQAQKYWRFIDSKIYS